MSEPRTGPTVPTALIAAHPGHELRIHRWVELNRPLITLLTDGSGSGPAGRLPSSRRLADRTGSRIGSVFGRWSDAGAYRLLFDHNLEAAGSAIHDIAQELVREDIHVVASDAVEGFNPTHDLCFVVAECAIRLAARQLGRPIRHLSYPLEGAPDPGNDPQQQLRIELDPVAWERKRRAAYDYTEIVAEVDRAFGSHSESAFRTEVLSHVVGCPDLEALALALADPPLYEQHGEARVAAGTYREVLRFREHWLPFALSLRDWVSSQCASC